MTVNVALDEFRARMNDFRDKLVQRARAEKDVNSVPLILEKHYSRLTDAEKPLAAQVVCEWLQSEETDTRWDAQFLIMKFKIRLAVNVLHELDLHLQKTSSDSAPGRAEICRVQSLIQVLSE